MVDCGFLLLASFAVSLLCLWWPTPLLGSYVLSSRSPSSGEVPTDTAVVIVPLYEFICDEESDVSICNERGDDGFRFCSFINLVKEETPPAFFSVWGFFIRGAATLCFVLVSVCMCCCCCCCCCCLWCRRVPLSLCPCYFFCFFPSIPSSAISRLSSPLRQSTQSAGSAATP